MFRIFQILQDSLSIQSLIKLYLRTGNTNQQLYDDIQKRWSQYVKQNSLYRSLPSLLSLDNENDITTPHYILQVRKTSSTPKVKSYSVAIHSNLTYILFEIIKDKNKYCAYIMKTITRDLEDYQDMYQHLLPVLFMEFIVSRVSVSKAFDCESSYITKENTPITLKGEKQNMCIYSNSLFVGDIGIIPAHDGLS